MGEIKGIARGQDRKGPNGFESRSSLDFFKSIGFKSSSKSKLIFGTSSDKDRARV